MHQACAKLMTFDGSTLEHEFSEILNDISAHICSKIRFKIILVGFPLVPIAKAFADCVVVMNLQTTDINFSSYLICFIVTVCDSDPCQNNGSCVLMNDPTSGYSCTCLHSYSGSNCESKCLI